MYFFEVHVKEKEPTYYISIGVAGKKWMEARMVSDERLYLLVGSEPRHKEGFNVGYNSCGRLYVCGCWDFFPTRRFYEAGAVISLLIVASNSHIDLVWFLDGENQFHLKEPTDTAHDKYPLYFTASLHSPGTVLVLQPASKTVHEHFVSPVGSGINVKHCLRNVATQLTLALRGVTKGFLSCRHRNNYKCETVTTRKVDLSCCAGPKSRAITCRSTPLVMSIPISTTLQKCSALCDTILSLLQHKQNQQDGEEYFQTIQFIKGVVGDFIREGVAQPIADLTHGDFGNLHHQLTEFENLLAKLNTSNRLVRFLTSSRVRKQLDDANAKLCSLGNNFQESLKRHTGASETTASQIITDPEGKTFWQNEFGNAIATDFDNFIFAMRKRFTINEETKKFLQYILDNSNTGVVTVYKIAEFLKGFGPLSDCVAKMSSVMRAKWFHGFLSSSEATRLLEGALPGTFLIRFSKSKPGSMALAYVDANRRVCHSLIAACPPMGFKISEDLNNCERERLFRTLDQLVTFYGYLLRSPLSTQLSREPMFHGDLTSQEASELLAGQSEGTFLFRFSAQSGYLAVSYVCSGDVKHALIRQAGDGFQFSEDPHTTYPTLREIVEAYKSILKIPFKVATFSVSDIVGDIFEHNAAAASTVDPFSALRLSTTSTPTMNVSTTATVSEVALALPVNTATTESMSTVDAIMAEIFTEDTAVNQLKRDFGIGAGTASTMSTIAGPLYGQIPLPSTAAEKTPTATALPTAATTPPPLIDNLPKSVRSTVELEEWLREATRHHTVSEGSGPAEAVRPRQPSAPETAAAQYRGVPNFLMHGVMPQRETNREKSGRDHYVQTLAVDMETGEAAREPKKEEEEEEDTEYKVSLYMPVEMASPKVGGELRLRTSPQTLYGAEHFARRSEFEVMPLPANGNAPKLPEKGENSTETAEQSTPLARRASPPSSPMSKGVDIPQTRQTGMPTEGTPPPASPPTRWQQPIRKGASGDCLLSGHRGR